jgi:hypothetical protein
MDWLMGMARVPIRFPVQLLRPVSRELQEVMLPANSYKEIHSILVESISLPKINLCSCLMDKARAHQVTGPAAQTGQQRAAGGHATFTQAHRDT